MDYPELASVIERILAVVPAQQIILFGSRARSEARPDSDYDLLVVVPEAFKTLQNYKALYHELGQVRRGFGVDLILTTPEDLERYREAWMTVYPHALREGRIVYAA
ncbi:nucleotidyltransferase domain-containing protein [Calidithermus roseus]|uniref:nucleotidyltransferase domain-containing protein n=1 Tax=Calidithermus roseus TaxID=1644118 RepID=UPI000E65BC05|nr:nucleotidyltransferase domain-containing protein [Calidithermus roseus]